MDIINKIGFLVSLLSITTGVNALPENDSISNQNTISTKKIMLLKTPWSELENASALSFFDYSKKIGSAFIYTEIQDKDYHLFRNGDALFKTGFFTEGFVKYKNWKFYGNFNYYSQTEKSVKWTGMMKPYNGNPYSIGDSIGGNYSKEYFNMEGRGSLPLNESLIFGFDIKYSAGVGVKRKDPRPENTITEFDISPAIIFNLNKLKLGAHFRYKGKKEDIEITDVTNNIYYIFHFKGLGIFSSTPEYENQIYISNSIGGGLQFNFGRKNLQNLTEINFYKKWTDVKRGETFPLQVVLLEKFNTRINSTFIFSSRKNNISRLNLFYDDKHIYGHEPVVEPKLESISYQWSTAAKYTLYWHKENEFGLKYSFYNIIDKHHFNWGGQLSGRFSSSETTYYFVPEFNRQKLNLLNVNVKLEKGFQINKGDIVIDINGGYRKNYNGELSLVEDQYLLTTVNSEMVTYDYEYFNSELLNLGASAKVGRNITVYRNEIQAFFETGINKMVSYLPGNPKSTIFDIKFGINF